MNIYFSIDKDKYVGENIYRSKEEVIKNKDFFGYIKTIKIEWEE